MPVNKVDGHVQKTYRLADVLGMPVSIVRHKSGRRLVVKSKVDILDGEVVWTKELRSVYGTLTNDHAAVMVVVSGDLALWVETDNTRHVYLYILDTSRIVIDPTLTVLLYGLSYTEALEKIKPCVVGRYTRDDLSKSSWREL